MEKYSYSAFAYVYDELMDNVPYDDWAEYLIGLLKENGVARVHGGGFAGTIQAFVKNAFVEEYRNRMDGIFGSGACKILKIRNEGGVLIL